MSRDFALSREFAEKEWRCPTDSAFHVVDTSKGEFDKALHPCIKCEQLVARELVDEGMANVADVETVTGVVRRHTPEAAAAVEVTNGEIAGVTVTSEGSGRDTTLTFLERHFAEITQTVADEFDRLAEQFVMPYGVTLRFADKVHPEAQKYVKIMSAGLFGNAPDSGVWHRYTHTMLQQITSRGVGEPPTIVEITSPTFAIHDQDRNRLVATIYMRVLPADHPVWGLSPVEVHVSEVLGNPLYTASGSTTFSFRALDLPAQREATQRSIPDEVTRSNLGALPLTAANLESVRRKLMIDSGLAFQPDTMLAATSRLDDAEMVRKWFATDQDILAQLRAALDTSNRQIDGMTIHQDEVSDASPLAHQRFGQQFFISKDLLEDACAEELARKPFRITGYDLQTDTYKGVPFLNGNVHSGVHSHGINTTGTHNHAWNAHSGVWGMGEAPLYPVEGSSVVGTALNTADTNGYVNVYIGDYCDSFQHSVPKDDGQVVVYKGWQPGLSTTSLLTPAELIADDEDDSLEEEPPAVPTDTRVPESFKVEERLCVRMTDEYGDTEDDTETWSTHEGAEGRLRQLMYARSELVSCEIAKVWKRV